MRFSVAVRLDRLLRDLRLTGHGLAEAAEHVVLRRLRRASDAKPFRAGRAAERGKEGERA